MRLTLRPTEMLNYKVLAIRYNSSAQSKTHYQTLGVPRTASVKEIKAAYIELCKKHHPDANPNDPQAQQRFVKLQEAYNVLSSPVERACYDVKINRASYKTPNYGSARSSDADFIRKYYQEKAREHQRQKDMEDWRYRTGKYRDHEMDEAIRKENERQRQAFQNIFQSGADDVLSYTLDMYFFFDWNSSLISLAETNTRYLSYLFIDEENQSGRNDHV
uniref:J domain-containing protein n=1 Tax=Magallana gigas TaxID=29159 RepID=A0A8W8HPU3_MAGGI